jgi:hypothetical protein
VGRTAVDRADIHDELERARATFRGLVLHASPTDLRRRTDGTRWTNQQLLFHMAFGYLIVRRLLPLVRFFGRLPDRYSLVFARVLNAGTRPFHAVNYLGACGGGLVFHGPRLVTLLDRTLDALHRGLDQEPGDRLAARMCFPVGWDPFFAETMSLLDVYHYGTVHFDFHQQQLTLGRA